MLRDYGIDDGREIFYAIYLDTRHKPIGPVYPVTVGSLNASLVHPREVFRPAVQHGAQALIVGHNHPSGDSMPSLDDMQLTQRLSKVGELLGIPLIDHIILGQDSHTSIREYGWPGGDSSEDD